ncbi:MAG: 50S ribosomal protein L11 methyltransferase [Balneolaceae bacterium]
MSYLKFVFEAPDDVHEFLIAELLDLDFYGFEQEENRLIAYVEKRRFNDMNREWIEQMMLTIPGGSVQEMDEIAETNWNETWEQTIRPQHIGRFFVRPTWSLEEAPPGLQLLEIDPKMSFGTGYHATTRLMLNTLSRLDLDGRKLLDAGTGTGILAIAALLIGAENAVAFDVDPWSERNATENALINRVAKQIDIRLGGFEVLDDDEQFGVVLANINRNVILEFLPQLVAFTEPGGTLCLTGLLQTDQEKVLDALESQPVSIASTATEEEWILFHLIRQGS